MGWLDAQICDRHRWRWVQTWHNVGFQECSACGMTRSVTERQVIDLDDRVRYPEEMRFEPEAEPAATASNARRGRGPSPSPEIARRNAAILEALAAGRRVRDLAREFSVSAATVYQLTWRSKRAQQGAAS